MLTQCLNITPPPYPLPASGAGELMEDTFHT